MAADKDDIGKIDQDLLEAALRRLLGQGGPQGAPPPPPMGWGPPPPGWWPPPPGYQAWYAPQGMPEDSGAAPPPPQGSAPGNQNLQQALIWAALGAALAWILSDPEVRDKLIKQVMKLYRELVVGFEEMKEKVADMKAEVDAGFPHQGEG